MRGLVVVLGALALVLGGEGSAVAKRPPVAFTDCLRLPLVKPAEVVLGCGDWTESFAVARWTHWTRRSASAVGTVGINDCTPSCVAGHAHSYPAVLLLDHPRPCGGSEQFTLGRLFLRRRHEVGASMGSMTLCPLP